MPWLKVDDICIEDRLLWACVLRRAVFDFVLYKGSGRYKLRWQRASNFIFAGLKDEDGLSFEEVCGLFGWEPDFLRRLTKGLTREDIKKLEASKFKKYFEDKTVEPPSRSLQWASFTAATPFLLPYHYSKMYADLLCPKRARRSRNRHVSILPLGIHWGLQVVANG